MKRFLTICILCYASVANAAQDLSIDAVYNNFNLRSIKSSYGPRLGYFCQSYLKDYFPLTSIVSKTANTLELENGDDVWSIKLIGRNKISVENKIKGATYHAITEHQLYFNSAASEWRAKKTFIAVPEKCVNFVHDKK